MYETVFSNQTLPYVLTPIEHHETKLPPTVIRRSKDNNIIQIQAGSSKIQNPKASSSIRYSRMHRVTKRNKSNDSHCLVNNWSLSRSLSLSSHLADAKYSLVSQHGAVMLAGRCPGPTSTFSAAPTTTRTRMQRNQYVTLVLVVVSLHMHTQTQPN
jgi:hypothetical protein